PEQGVPGLRRRPVPAGADRGPVTRGPGPPRRRCGQGALPRLQRRTAEEPAVRRGGAGLRRDPAAGHGGVPRSGRRRPGSRDRGAAQDGRRDRRGARSTGGGRPMNKPTYDELAGARPPYSAWEVFGPDDELGTVNWLTPDRVAAAARLVRTGERFSLDHPVNAFEPYPTGTRPTTRHHVFANNEFHRHDWLDSFYLQSTSQIDALRHIGHPQHGFYNGPPAQENTGDSARLGIHRWAQAGIAGRG